MAEESIEMKGYPDREATLSSVQSTAIMDSHDGSVDSAVAERREDATKQPAPDPLDAHEAFAQVPVKVKDYRAPSPNENSQPKPSVVSAYGADSNAGLLSASSDNVPIGKQRGQHHTNREGADYIMVYYKAGAKKIKKKDEMKVEKQEEIREKYFQTCEEKGLRLEYDTDQDDVIFVLVTASFERLCIAAEQNNIRLPLKRNAEREAAGNKEEKDFKKKNPKNCPQLGCGNNCGTGVGLRDEDDDGLDWATFSLERRNLFLNYNDEEKFFTQTQRSYLVYQILNHIQYGPKRGHVGFMKLMNMGVLLTCYPAHDGPADTSYGATLVDCDRLTLVNTWAKYSKMFKPQPFELIRSYFGEKVAFYFVWIGFYTRWLIPASIAGLIVFIYGVATFSSFGPANELCTSNLVICAPSDNTPAYSLNTTCGSYRVSALFDHALTIPFAVFMSIWATFFHEFWKRQSNIAAFKWDTRGIEEEEVTRPQFVPTLTRISPITGKQEDYFPWEVRMKRMAASMSMVICMLLVVLAAVFAVIVYRIAVRISLYNADPSGPIGNNSALITSVTAAILNLIAIIILNQIYGRIARRLNDWENHPTETVYEDNLIFKTYLFQFVNSYASIFYIAFFKGKFIGYPGNWDTLGGYRLDICPAYGCLTELAIQLAIIMIGKQVIGNIVEIALPMIKNRCKKRDLGTDAASAKQYERDLSLEEFPGLFAEYLEMILQLGFATLFVVAFPLAPVFALINNIFEIRLDAKKFVFQAKRCPGIRAEDIGTWEKIMAVLSTIAVVTNAFVIAFTASILDQITYNSMNGNLNGYILNQYAPSPITSCAGQPTTQYCECYYLGYRNPDGSLSTFHYHVLAVKLAFIILFEHIIFFLKALLAFLVPDVPYEIEVAIAREEYMGRLAFGLVHESESEDDTPENAPTKSAHSSKDK